jgi:hypothetical protein
LEEGVQVDVLDLNIHKMIKTVQHPLSISKEAGYQGSSCFFDYCFEPIDERGTNMKKLLRGLVIALMLIGLVGLSTGIVYADDMGGSMATTDGQPIQPPQGR